MCCCIYIYIYIDTSIYIFFHHTTCESTCDTLSSSAANQGDNTVSVTQGGTAIPGATKQLMHVVWYVYRYIYCALSISLSLSLSLSMYIYISKVGDLKAPF